MHLRRTAATLILSSAFASLAWADDSPWRPAPGAGQRAAARAQSPDDISELRITLGAPRARLGAPRARTEAASSASDIQPTLFSTPSSASKPMPLPEDDKAKGSDKKDDKKAELVPLPSPAAGQPARLTAQPAPTAVQPPPGYVFAMPGGDAGVPVVPPQGFAGMPGDPCLGGACPEGVPFGCMIEGPHGPMGRVYMNFEFLAWSLKSDKVPALVTQGTPDSLGIIGLPGTTVLLEGDIDQGMYLGGRVQIGVWFDPCERFGMVGSFFALQERTKTYTFGSNGDPVIGRPFFNPLDGGAEDVELVAAGDLLSGRVTVQSQTRLLGGDLNFRWNLSQGTWVTKNGKVKPWNIDFIAGARFLRLDESLSITENLVDGPEGDDPGARTVVRDQFSAVNNFYGGQIGLIGELRHKRWFLNATAKVAFGVTQQQVGIDGSTTFDLTDAPPITQPAGILALRSNIGQYDRNVFSVVPELGVNVGYQLTDHFRLYVGYNILFWTNVARPGQQIDRVSNPNNWPSTADAGGNAPPQRPAFVFRDGNFWAQGVTAGFEWRF